MKTLRDLKDVKLIEKGTVVAVGVFDGVHKGHQRIIKTAAKEARRRGAQTVVATFEPHPKEVLKPGSHPPILTTTDIKVELIEKLEVDYLVIIPFTEKFGMLTPEQFVREVLLDLFNLECIVVGEDFRFGKDIQGDVKLLETYGDKYHFDVVSVPSVKVKSRIVSSTLVRELLKMGDLEGVRVALGRFPKIAGKVVKGHSRGRRLGFPTANIETFGKAQVPKIGVYVGFAYISGKRIPCVIDIGTSPTFGGGKEIIHVHIVHFDQDIYQERLEIEVVGKIRDEKSFPDEASLSKQIAEDIKTAQKILSNQQ